MTVFSPVEIAKYGNPADQMAQISGPWAPCVKNDEAKVRTLFSPIHPADYLAMPGTESVVEVVSGNSFSKGDRAIPLQMGWCHCGPEGVIDEAELFKVSKELPLEVAATLAINPTTAYILLNDITKLQPGDVVIQNGANSACGQAVIQLARAAGIRTINVIRNRPNFSETAEQLKELGADAVITYEQLSLGLETLRLGLPAPKLGLECVGGRAAKDLQMTLCQGGSLVVYGTLSGEPAQFDQRTVIVRNIRIAGFTLFRWRMERAPEEFTKLLNKLVSFYLNGDLVPPKFRKFPVSQWREAVKHTMKGFSDEKSLLEFEL